MYDMYRAVDTSSPIPSASENEAALSNSHNDSMNGSNNNSATVCGICLDEFALESLHVLKKCQCAFCRDCLCKYFQFMIDNGHLHIFCPSHRCMANSQIEAEEVADLVSVAHQAKYQVMRDNKVLNEYLAANQSKVRCPFCDSIFDVHVVAPAKKEKRLQRRSSEAEVIDVEEDDEEVMITEETKTISNTISQEEENSSAAQSSTSEAETAAAKKAVRCPNCLEAFCATCHIRLETLEGGHNCADLNEAVLSEYDIKKCPSCSYLIQREGGCAQISCRNCQHVFCWWCMASLNNDFLLMHFSSGPCKGKLGHSRLSIFFNRVQTVSICIGISILMILASPVILLTLPCLLTSRCRQCCSRGGGGDRGGQHRNNHNNNHKSNRSTGQQRRGEATAV